MVTHRKVFQSPSSAGEAFDFLAAHLESPSCQVLVPGSSFMAFFREAVADSSATGNLVFDAHIVAICREHGVSTVLTEDGDFGRFRRLRIERL